LRARAIVYTPIDARGIGGFFAEKWWSLAICLAIEVFAVPIIGGALLADLKRFAKIWEESHSRNLVALLQ
jgi:hypothetical protein